VAQEKNRERQPSGLETGWESDLMRALDAAQVVGTGLVAYSCADSHSAYETDRLVEVLAELEVLLDSEVAVRNVEVALQKKIGFVHDTGVGDRNYYIQETVLLLIVQEW
jgi:hypothetical protein